MSAFWTIDGPAAFVQRVKSANQDGRSVITLLPSFVASGFADAIRTCLRVENTTPKTVILRDGLPPNECVATSLGFRSDDSSEVPIPERVASYAGTIIVHLPRAEHHSAWILWAQSVGVLARELTHSGRLRFILVLEGRAELLSWSEPSCLVLTWQGVIREIDCLTTADRSLAGRRCTALERVVLRNTLAFVAGWDAELVSALARATTLDVCTSEGLMAKLAEFGRRRGWTNATSAEIRFGTMANIEGRDEVHPAIMAMKGQNAAISTLLWRAQFTSLFPWIDDERYSWARRLAPRLATSNPGDFLKLEIGELAFAAGKGRIERTTVDRLHFLREVRNFLAHREPLSWDYLRRCLQT